MPTFPIEEFHGVIAALAAAPIAAVIAYVLGKRRGRRRARPTGSPPGGRNGRVRASTGRGDLIAAAIATAVSAEGMWETFGALDMPVPLRIATFAFIELAVLQAARRAKRSMEERYSAGVDGIAMWVLTCVSAVLSAAHEITADRPNAAVILVRLVAPLVAAWGWERHMALERRARGLRSGIAWRITPERIAVRLGLAEASERTTEQVDARRRINRVAHAVKALSVLESARARPRRVQRARQRLDLLMQEANEHAGLAHDPQLQAELMAEIGSLLNTGGLSRLNTPAWWTPAPARTDPRPRICAGRTGLLQARPYGARRTGPDDAELEREASKLKASVRRLRALGRTGYGPGPEAGDIARTGLVRDVAVRAEPLRTESEVGPVQPARTGGAVVPLQRHVWLADEEHVHLPEVRTAGPHCGKAVSPTGARARTRGARTAASRTGRTEVRADVRKGRAEWVAILAEEIRTARTEGRTWELDYDALQTRTTYGRSWCEKTVRAARQAAEQPDETRPADRTGTDNT